MNKTYKYLLLFFLLIFGVFFWFITRKPKWTWHIERIDRCGALEQWFHLANLSEYSSNTSFNLYDLSIEMDNLSGNSIDRYLPTHLCLRLPEDYAKQIKDPNAFDKLVPYRLYKSGETWIIKEAEECIDLYPQLLMIDQNGIIYELKEVRKSRPTNELYGIEKRVN